MYGGAVVGQLRGEVSVRRLESVSRKEGKFRGEDWGVSV